MYQFRRRYTVTDYFLSLMDNAPVWSPSDEVAVLVSLRDSKDPVTVKCLNHISFSDGGLKPYFDDISQSHIIRNGEIRVLPKELVKRCMQSGMRFEILNYRRKDDKDTEQTIDSTGREDAGKNAGQDIQDGDGCDNADMPSADTGRDCQ